MVAGLVCGMIVNNHLWFQGLSGSRYYPNLVLLPDNAEGAFKQGIIPISMYVYPRPANLIPSCTCTDVLSRHNTLEHLMVGFVHDFRPANYTVCTEILDSGLLYKDIMIRLQTQLQRSLLRKAKGQIEVRVGVNSMRRGMDNGILESGLAIPGRRLYRMR
jgi:hypothetical protein